MPIPFVAAGAVAAVVGATHNCEPDDVSIADKKKKEENDTDNNMLNAYESTRDLSSIRAIEMGSSSCRGSLHHRASGGSIHLRRSENPPAIDSSFSGFVDGNFTSGKIHDLVIERKTHTMAYLPTGSLLAVGTKISLDFYETTQYSLVYRLDRDGMVSALKWLPLSSATSLLAVGSLNGRVSLFRIDEEILESQGPSLLFDFEVDNQVRAIDCTFFGKLEPTVMVAVGDKSGTVSFASFDTDFEHIGTHAVLNFSNGVLGLAVCPDKALVACSTKGGDVAVYHIHRDPMKAVILEEKVWYTHRSGHVRCVQFSHDGSYLAFGGYDKKVAMVDTELWVIFRELPLQGTVNVLVQDPRSRYVAVGCRDKTFTLFDTSTFVPVKIFHTLGWVTSISWGYAQRGRDIVAVRSENSCISVLDLSAISKTDIQLPSWNGEELSVSWNFSGKFLVRTVGPMLMVSETEGEFEDIAAYRVTGTGIITRAAFCRASDKKDLIAVVDTAGNLTVLRLREHSSNFSLEKVQTVLVEPHLQALAWSNDGTYLATGGRGKHLHVFSADELKARVASIDLQARVWDIDFSPEAVASDSLFVAVALGDYTAIVLSTSFEPTLQINRSRRVKCLKHHPHEPLLAVGDSAGTVAVVDISSEEIVYDMDVADRVNTLDFSPAGEYLAIGTDACCLSLLDTSSYQCVQEVRCSGFAITAAFSPNGAYLALGSASESYTLVQLGPFLGIDLVPLTLEKGVSMLPTWAMNEALYRSGDGDSFIQRHMRKGGADNLRRVAIILREHPEALFAYNRSTNEGCLDTALQLRKPNLLKLAVTTLVDGTLDNYNDGNKSILTTSAPQRGRETLMELIENFSSDLVVDIFNEMTFMKVPFTEPRIVAPGSNLQRGSSSYTDPWDRSKSISRLHQKELESSEKHDRSARSDLSRTPAILPLPGLGELDFLVSLLTNVSPRVFDNDAMGLVLAVMWKQHMRKYFIMDFLLFAAFYTVWTILVERTLSFKMAPSLGEDLYESVLALLTLVLNSGSALKEIIQSRYGRRLHYFTSAWNFVDLLSIVGVYMYLIELYTQLIGNGSLVPLAVVTSLLLTVKLLGYFRGFSITGWLISVLTANFRDVRGFLLILFAILVGFSLAFRVLFAGTGDEAYGSIRRAFLSTFEMTIVGSYDPELFFEAKYNVLAVITFVLAITCVLVIALNALISILADSYARVQENLTANRRKEKAELIVEYMSLLLPRTRRMIERDTKWFHVLLEVDDDGDLLVQKDGWEGGLNALRRDIEELEEETRESHQKALDTMKSAIDSELASFRREVVSLLDDLADDVKRVRKVQSQGGVTFSGKNVAKAVKAVKSIGRRGSPHT